MNTLVKISVVILLSAISLTSFGFVLSKLWLWHITPTFGLPPLTLVQSTGIMLVVNFFKMKLEDTKQEDSFSEQVAKGFAFLILALLMTLLFGYVISLFY